VRVFKSKEFARFAARADIRDRQLCETVDRLERGLVDADLGGGLFKQRVPRPGEGRSGGFRTVLAYRERNLSVFLYGFPKNAKANLTTDELRLYRKLAAAYLRLTEAEIELATDEGELVEVSDD
jgi:hypothetical protein